MKYLKSFLTKSHYSLLILSSIGLSNNIVPSTPGTPTNSEIPMEIQKTVENQLVPTPYYPSHFLPAFIEEANSFARVLTQLFQQSTDPQIWQEFTSMTKQTNLWAQQHIEWISQYTLGNKPLATRYKITYPSESGSIEVTSMFVEGSHHTAKAMSRPPIFLGFTLNTQSKEVAKKLTLKFESTSDAELRTLPFHDYFLDTLAVRLYKEWDKIDDYASGIKNPNDPNEFLLKILAPYPSITEACENGIQESLFGDAICNLVFVDESKRFVFPGKSPRPLSPSLNPATNQQVKTLGMLGISASEWQKTKYLTLEWAKTRLQKLEQEGVVIDEDSRIGYYKLDQEEIQEEK